MTRVLLSLLIGGALAVSAVSAQPKSDLAADKTTGCKKPLDECTKERITSLKGQSRKLTAASRMKPPKPLEGEERATVEGYDRWLVVQANKLRELAERGGAATTESTQTSFNQQYLQLQQQMVSEHNRFRQVAEIMKNKHDAVRAALQAK